MSRNTGIFHRVHQRVMTFFYRFSIYHKMFLLIIAVMFFSSLLVGWQSAKTIWENSQAEQNALASNLLRLSLQKIHVDHQLLVQHKYLMIVHQRKMLEESLTTMLPLFEGLDSRSHQTDMPEKKMQDLALNLLRLYPHTKENLFFVFNNDLEPVFLPSTTLSLESLQRARTFLGQNSLATAQRGCQKKGNYFLTLQFADAQSQEQSYAGYFVYFKPWNWIVARISSSNGLKSLIAEHRRSFFSQVTTYLADIPTKKGSLILLNRETNKMLFPLNIPQKQIHSLLRASLALYGINRENSIYLPSVDGLPPCDMYSATYPGLKLQVLYLAPRTHLVETAVNLIMKQVVIIISLFLVSVVITFLILKRFTAPLVELTNFAKELSSTDCILPSPSLRRLEQLSHHAPYETSKLAHSFLLLQKVLSERIQDLIKASHDNKVIADALHRLNMELDLRVQERTRQLEEANKELQTLEKNKTDFLSSVSHELRTPMTAIGGFVTMIRNRLEERIYPLLLQHDLQKHIDRINRDLGIVSSECVRLTSLIETVLDIAKIESGNIQLRREEFDPLAAISHAAQTVSVLFEQADIRLELDLPESLPLLTGDPDRVIQVIINLLSNALKYTHHGSVSCRARRMGNTVLIQITDSGIGIPPEKLSSIFGKYIQLDDSWNFRIKGTGLGLSISKMIVEAQGGSIQVTSVVNQGSTFTVTLPIRQQPETQPEKSNPPLTPH